MRKLATTTLAFFALLFAGQTVHAQQVIEVEAGQNTLLDAADEAQPGDILELTDGGQTYLINDELQVPEDLTVRAAKGLSERPIIYRNDNPSTSDVIRLTGGSLTLQGIEIDGGADPDSTTKYAIRTDDTSGDENAAQNYTLKVLDSYIHDVVDGSDGNALRTYPGSYADSIIFRNTTIRNTGKQGIRINMGTGYDFVPAVSPNSFGVGYFEATNVTMSNTVQEGIAIWGGDEDFSTEGPTVRVDHLTCDGCGGDGKRALNMWQVNDTKIRNVLLTNSPGNDDVVKIYGPDASINYVDTMNVGGDLDASDDAQVGDDVFGMDPLYVDAENGDFTLADDSPVRDLGSDGLALGDTRNAGQALAVEPTNGRIPDHLTLRQNHPNPVQSSTAIPFKLDRPSQVTLRVYDVLGRRVKTVTNQQLSAGAYEATFDAGDLPSGVYFYSLEAAGQTVTRKMTVVK